MKNIISYCFFIALVSFFSSCKAQPTTISVTKATRITEHGTVIIGTPPPPGIGAFSPVNDSTLISQYIRTIFEDSRGNMWFGPAGQSVARYRPSQNGSAGQDDTLQYYSRNEFFHGNETVTQDYGNSVQAIAEDHKGNLWFGTYNGVVRYDALQGKTFKSYTVKNGLRNINVGRKSILTDHSGIVWVGTAGGVYQYVETADSFSQFSLVPPIHVTGLIEDHADNTSTERSRSIWIASEDNGVFRYNPQMKNEKVITNFTQCEDIGNNYAGGMDEDKAGNIWFVMKNGICSYNPKDNTFKEITSKDGLVGEEFWGLLIEESGIIWITARGSTTRYDPAIPISDPGALKVWKPENGLNCCVQSMYQDKSGNIWFGAGEGLYRFNGKDFYKVKQDGPWK